MHDTLADPCCRLVGTPTERLIQLVLAARPHLTRPQLHNATGGTYGTVYTAIHHLLDQGIIMRSSDDHVPSFALTN